MLRRVKAEARDSGSRAKERTLKLITASRFGDAAVAPQLPVGETPPGASNLNLILATLDDAKAEDIVNIDLQGKTTLADHMVIASGRSNRHVGAIAEQLVEALGKVGRKGLRIEGMPHCDWVLIDEGDVIVHVFRPEVREFYNLEKMWSAARPSERSVA
jgi:ribosome-associated protein